jgi:hypothetical protein
MGDNLPLRRVYSEASSALRVPTPPFDMEAEVLYRHDRLPELPQEE